MCVVTGCPAISSSQFWRVWQYFREGHTSGGLSPTRQRGMAFTSSVVACFPRSRVGLRNPHSIALPKDLPHPSTFLPAW